jgi:hypothetical protein
VTLHIGIETMEKVRVIAEKQSLPPDDLLHVWMPGRRDIEMQRRGGAANRPPDSPSPPETAANGTTAEPTQEPKE